MSPGARARDKRVPYRRLLRHDGDARAQLVEADRRKIDAVERNGAFLRLDDAEQREQERALAGAGAADDADLGARRHAE